MKRLALTIALLVIPAAATAQVALPPPETALALALGTGPAPGSQGPEMWTGVPGDLTVRNTVEATLLPVLPQAANATGEAIVIAPGGAYMTLSYDHEGTRVARALAERGIAAFVLKYRLKPTPRPMPEFGKAMIRQLTDWVGKPGEGLKVGTPTYAVDDAVAALRLVRQRAKGWKIDPARVGMMGFSAGARLTLATVAAASPQDMPAFAAPIYPPMEGIAVPQMAPPLFVAMASDDPLSGKAGHALIQSWIEAGKPVEFHSFQKGGHGFGLGSRGNTTDGWINLLARWIRFNTLAGAAK